jgi:hypothetical protein
MATSPGAGPAAGGNHEIERLQATHLAMVEIYLHGGHHADVERELGITQQSASRIFTSAMFQGELARRKRDVAVQSSELVAANQTKMRERVSEAGVTAAETLLSLMENSESESARLKAAEISLRTAMDMDGSGKTQPVAQVPTTVNYTLLLAGLREAKLPTPPDPSDNVLDVVPEPAPEPKELPGAF